MVVLVIDENNKIRKFQGIEQAEKYMSRHKGTYFMVELLGKYLGVSVVESENGEVIQKKGLTISRSD